MVVAGEALHRRELPLQLRLRRGALELWHDAVHQLTHANLTMWLGAALLVYGLLLRARGELFGAAPNLWGDEAAWAIRLMNWPLLKHALRPLGFIAVCRQLAVWFSPSEQILRLVPWLGSVASLGLTLPLGRRLFQSSAARLLFIGVFALHPWAIDLGKEFKPYALALALHMV